MLVRTRKTIVCFTAIRENFQSQSIKSMIAIRRAEKTDADIFSKICMEIWGGTDAVKISNYFSKAITVFKSGYFLATLKNEIIGTGEGFPIREKLEISQMNQVEDPVDLYDQNGAYFYIHGIEILPDYRKNGFGSRIVNEYVKTARSFHCKEICGIAISGNINFWLKQGFTIEGGFHQYKNFGEFAWVSKNLESQGRGKK